VQKKVAMELTNRFRRLVRKMHQLLQLHGYQTRGQSAWRERPHFATAVVLHRAWYNTKEKCRFDCEIGIFIPELLRMRGIEPPPYPKEGYLQIALDLDDAAYLNMRVPPPPPRESRPYWTLLADAPVERDEAIWREIEFRLTTYALPFLEQFHTLEDVISYLEWLRVHWESLRRHPIWPNDVWIPFYLIGLYWMVGDMERCEQEMAVCERDFARDDYFQHAKAYMKSHPVPAKRG
jgi:hypothetical protein